MPIYEYVCPYGHKHQTLRKYEHRMDADPCPKCGGFRRRIERGKDCVVESLEVADG